MKPSVAQMNELLRDASDGGPVSIPAEWDVDYVVKTIEDAAACKDVIVEVGVDRATNETVLILDELLVLE